MRTLAGRAGGADRYGGTVVAGSVSALASVGALVAAAAGARWPTLAALAVSAISHLAGAHLAGAHPAGARRPLPLPPAVRRFDWGWSGAAIRLLSLVLLAARTDRSTAVVVGTAATAAVLATMASAGSLAGVVVEHLRRPPLLSRNLPLGDLEVPSPPPRVVTHGPGQCLAPVLAALGLAGWPRDPAPVAVLLAAAAVVAAAGPVWLAAHAWQLRRRDVRGVVEAAVHTAVDRLQPRVILYFAGNAEECYQPDMWLEPVERLGLPAAVVVRDVRVLERLGPTSLPVVCVPYNGTLARLPLPPVVAVLFPTHSGNNVAMLRRLEARRVFVGHGDSDKPDSVNPFARVYDEVWVAGPLGRHRYAEAAVGVRDDAIVEIGRPQLHPIDGPPPSVPTVLYAPTWEGWGDDPHHSSLPHVGPALVRALLATDGVRVLYRPHPLTGRRDPAVRRAHAEVLALLRAAGAVGGTLEARSGGAADPLEMALTTGHTPTDAAAVRAEGDRAVDRFWSSAGERRHRIVATDGASLASCFARTSVLVADVSSVVTEFLVADRPYAVVDTRGVGEAAMHAAYPVTAGGFVLGADLGGLDAVLAAATTGPDPTTTARRQLRADALGDPASAPERFASAVQRLLTAR